MPNIKPEEIESLLSELQIGLTELAKSEALSKAHPGEETKGEVDPDKSATSDGPKDDAPPKADASAEKPADGPPADKSAPPADASATPGAPDASASADPAAEDDGPVDPIKLHEEYAALSPEDLKAHYIACKAALFELVGSGDKPDAAPDMGAAPPMAPAAPPAAPPASPSPSPDAPPTLKGEKDMSGGANGGKQLPIAKSEADLKIEALEKSIATERDALAKLAAAMETAFMTPVRKSIVDIAQLPAEKKTKAITDLSRDEVRAKLREKVTEGKLSKSDQELVIKFDLNSIKVQDVAHILESKTS